RLSLLSRASTLAIIAAAAGGLGSVQQAQAAGCTTTTAITDATPMPLGTSVTCATVHTTVNHDVVNEANIGDPGSGNASFFVGKGGLINGQLWNKATISGSSGDGLGTLTVTDGGTITNGILNDGQILSSNSNAIQIGTGTGGEGSPGHIQGGITNNDAIT